METQNILNKFLNINNIRTIFLKELRSYFNSPLAYIVICVFFVLMGWFFASAIFLINVASLRSMFEYAAIIFMLIIPAITMRLLAEEKKSGTIELLTTKPLYDWELVLGKFFASWAFMAITLIPTLVYYITMLALGDIDNGPVLGGYIGLLLMTGVYVAVGLLASSLTENQIIAFILGLLFCVTLFFVDSMLLIVPEYFASILQYISIDYHFRSIARGVIDSRDIIYFLSILIFSLYLSVVSLEKRKW